MLWISCRRLVQIWTELSIGMETTPRLALPHATCGCHMAACHRRQCCHKLQELPDVNIKLWRQDCAIAIGLAVLLPEPDEEAAILFANCLLPVLLPYWPGSKPRLQGHMWVTCLMPIKSFSLPLLCTLKIDSDNCSQHEFCSTVVHK
ncbi:hypothetical protein ACLKA6_010444 [Drosophila palustris]